VFTKSFWFSDSEMTTDQFYESFLNFSHSKRELDLIKKLHVDVVEKCSKLSGKKVKRKSPIIKPAYISKESSVASTS